jgi:hypothetical protein
MNMEARCDKSAVLHQISCRNGTALRADPFHTKNSKDVHVDAVAASQQQMGVLVDGPDGFVYSELNAARSSEECNAPGILFCDC